MRLEDCLVVLARVGAALIRVVEEPGRGASTTERHVERPDGEVPIVDSAQGPTHDEARVQVEDRSQVDPAARRDELRGVPNPPLVRPRRGELPAEEIGSDRLLVVTHRRAAVPTPRSSDEPLGPHEADDALPAHPYVLAPERQVNPGAPVGPTGPEVRLADQDPELLVLLLPRGRGA